jgi:hypothetical protein
MAVSAPPAAKRPSTFSVLLASVARVLFATLLFTAGGMAVGLMLGIIGTLLWGAIHGGPVDMRHAYLNVAIPLAALSGSIALLGTIYLEVKARRTAR